MCWTWLKISGNPVFKTPGRYLQLLTFLHLNCQFLLTFLFFTVKEAFGWWIPGDNNKERKKTSGKKQCYKSLAKGKPENNEISTLGIIYLHIASFRFSTLYSRPCCIKKNIIIKTRGYNRNYWDPEEVDPTIGCMVLSVHHMWVEFVVGPLLCSERFLPGYSGFPLSSKTNIFQIPIRPGIR